MKLKKMLMISFSTLVFGSFFPSFVNVVGHTQNEVVVFAQEDKLALLSKIKFNLLSQEPIVETQLAKVSNEDLLKFYDAASDATPWQDIYHSITSHYSNLGLITDSTEISKFKTILAEVINVSGKTAEELKNVDPKALISGYDAANQAHPDDATQAIQTLVAGLDFSYGQLSDSERAAVQAAELALVEETTVAPETTEAVTEATTVEETAADTTEATTVEETAAEMTEATTVEETAAEAIETTTLEETTVEVTEATTAESTEETTSAEDTTVEVTEATTAESTGATTGAETTLVPETTLNSEETVQPTSEEEQFRQKLLERTDITAEQLASISSQELSKISGISGLPLTATDDNYLQVFRRELVTNYPERFTTQQIYDVANILREFAIAHTPMTQAIASQIPDEDFLQWSREAYLQGNDITYPYQQAYKNYPKLFDQLLESTKNNLTTKTNLTAEQLKNIDPMLMMLLNWEAEVNVTTYQDVEKTLLENYQSNPVETTTVQAETTTQTTTQAPTTTEQTTTQALQVTKTKQVQKGLLPKTGERSSLWIVVGAIVLAGVGLMLLKNKRK